MIDSYSNIDEEQPPIKPSQTSGPLAKRTRTSATSSLVIRLTKDLKTLLANPPHGVIDASIVSDSVLVWKIALQIDELPFSDTIIELYLGFKPDHPYVSPSVTFVNHMFHPNVDEKTNQLCIDGKWNPVYDVSAFLVTVLALLRCPNMSTEFSPANPSAFMMLTKCTESYKQSARSFVKTRFNSTENMSQLSPDVSEGMAIFQSLLDPKLPLLFFAMPESAEAFWICANCARMNICSRSTCHGCGGMSADAALKKHQSKQSSSYDPTRDPRGSTNGDTALHHASRNGDLEAVRRVLDDRVNVVDVNAVNFKRNTALHIACNFGYRDIVSLLLSAGANSALKNCCNRNPKECAVFKGNLHITDFFE